MALSPHYEDDQASLYLGDCLDVMASLPDGSVDLIVTDPPFYKVKNLPWDNQWDDPAGFLAWIARLSKEWSRVLAPNGSLYCFASPQMAARVEVAIGHDFSILNSITWHKDAGWHKRNRPSDLRSYLRPWERIVFAEHFGSDKVAIQRAGLRPSAVKSVKDYEEFRRPFSVSAEVPCTDIWTYPVVQVGGKHPCEKPHEMMLDIIRASSTEGAVVLDCFAGSGATLKAAVALGRHAIGAELDPAWADKIAEALGGVQGRPLDS